MLKNIIKISLLSSVFSLVVTIPAMPYSAFTDQAKELYSVRSRCEMCHIGPQLNSFGKDFAMEWGKTHDIVKSYKAIENLDSDRDGFLNIDEIIFQKKNQTFREKIFLIERFAVYLHSAKRMPRWRNW